jgi:hypothetical protein
MAESISVDNDGNSSVTVVIPLICQMKSLTMGGMNCIKEKNFSLCHFQPLNPMG